MALTGGVLYAKVVFKKCVVKRLFNASNKASLSIQGVKQVVNRQLFPFNGAREVTAGTNTLYSRPSEKCF
jgi:hypothetical protein